MKLALGHNDIRFCFHVFKSDSLKFPKEESEDLLLQASRDSVFQRVIFVSFEVTIKFLLQDRFKQNSYRFSKDLSKPLRV